eukprot:Gb_33974 [translate_table: standard]
MDSQGRFAEASKREMKKRALLDRWRDIEEEESVQDGSAAEDAEFRRRKEDWFSDAFHFLIQLPEEIHIWCGYQDVMWPLLEPFCSYFEYKQDDLPLKVLWKRVCQELQICTQCIVQHHKAQELYKSEFEDDIVKPLLTVLQMLDEERVAKYLIDINFRVKGNRLDAEKEYVKVVSVLFEVLMFPDLLDDEAIVKEFVPFLKEVESSHNLTLAGNQQYPGVYALLFLQCKDVRAIGFRLAGFLGKLRNASELEPIQPLLKKCINFLDNGLPNKGTSRPRIQYEREAVWLGIKSLIGFLEPSAFEEGVVERYPIFLSIVLNYVSDDNPLDFAQAVDCLKLLFETLGCKLWLKTTFSPGVMRNTLLGQCFHTRVEKHHKAIFDLFQPFLQSLEALQDGEYERQRRHFLYFLLHQVSHSSNFSVLMKKKARQIAIFIIGRGYRMDPPCPPFECAHMWGPSLVHSLIDSSLHSSLRQPAFELIQTIIVADAAALISLWARHCDRYISFAKSPCDINEDDDELQSFHEIEETESNCWTEFNKLSKLAARECEEWFCIPLLWVEVLVGMSPAVLPLSFSKSVIWALSRFSVIEPEKSKSVTMSVSQWISVSFEKVAGSLEWENPKGCDDGANGKGSVNTLKASRQCMELLRIMRRCAAYYASQIEGSELCKQWTWEPRMAETIILLLLDPDDFVRQVDRIILEQVSNAKGLVSGLRFLCSSQASLSAMSLGLRYAIKLLLADSLSSTSRILHHLFFVVSKLLMSRESSSKGACNDQGDGGFLQPSLYAAASPQVILGDPSNERNEKAWKKFCELLSDSIWPLLLKCLREGKPLVQEKIYQMTFVRLLEILPLIFQHISSSQFKAGEDSNFAMSRRVELKWFYDLISWGNSQLLVIRRHWKQGLVGILKILKNLTHGSSLNFINNMESILGSDTLLLDGLQEQASMLSISFSEVNGSLFEREREEEPVHNAILRSEGRNPVVKLQNIEQEVIELCKVINESEIIIVSDDEVEKDRESSCVPSKAYAHAKSGFQQTLPIDDEKLIPGDESSYKSLSNKQNFRKSKENIASVTSSSLSCALDSSLSGMNFRNIHVIKESPLASESYDNRCSAIPQPADISLDVPASNAQSAVAEHMSLASPATAEENVWSVQTKEHEKEKQITSSDDLDRVGPSLIGERDSGSQGFRDKNCDLENLTRSMNAQKIATGFKSNEELVLKELVSGSKEDPLEVALDAARNVQQLSTKSGVLPKRQLIHLQVPLEHDKGSFERFNVGMKKYTPPRLDNWYKSILELDYFSIVGISLPESKAENLQVGHLTEVPTSFHSPDHYVEVFRPLVLEEFKAQMRHSFEEVSSPEEMCCGSLRLLSLEKVDDFQLGRFMSEAGEDAASRGCCENDLVLLSRQPFQIVSQNVHMIGKVERRERNTKSRCTILVLRLYLHSGTMRLAKARRLLIERSKWCVTRLLSITPQLREFQALSALKDLPLLPVILNPCRAAMKSSHLNIQTKGLELKRLPEPFLEQLRAAFNESQLRAISAILEGSDSGSSSELSLIQGPPGTGKTRTILAIVSVLLAISKFSKECNVGVERDSLSSTKSTVTSCLPCGKQAVNQSVAIARAWQDAALARQLIKRTNDSVPKTSGVEGSKRARVLVCAQSNAAVDELVSRICQDGLYNVHGKKYKPYIVRVGNVKTVHPNSLPVFIDTLVEQRLGEKRQNEADSRDDKAHNLTAMLRSKLEKLVDSIQMYEAQRSSRQDERSKNKNTMEDNGDGLLKSEAALKAKLNLLYKQKRGICTELAVAEAEEKKTFEENRAIKQALRRDIIREAEVVVTTLSGCGGDIYTTCIESVSRNRNGKAVGDALFDAVVIDEAAQALEPATLIPLQLLRSTSARCVMVGDPKQLPATVLSQLASKFSYECSMFERLQRADYPVTMLSTQYRMHPEICRFPSAHFYDNQLKDGGLLEGSRSAPFHESLYLGPFVFFDVVDGHEKSGRSIRAQSLCNNSEVDVALEILKFLKLRYPSEFLPGRIGIITPYKQQLSELRLRFTREFGPSIAGDMEFNTVDGFQGREVDMLIFSTVRASSKDVEMQASKSGSIGFVSDVRRMNVALTRAKISLWIVGNARTLQQSPHWAALLKNVKERNLLFSVQRPYETIFNSTFSDSSTKSFPAADSNSKQASTKYVRDLRKFSYGQQDGKRFKRDSKVHECGLENVAQMEANSQLAPTLRNTGKNSQSSLSANKKNDILGNGAGVQGKKSNDSKNFNEGSGREHKYHKSERETESSKNSDEKARKPDCHSEKNKSKDKSDLRLHKDEHQNKATENKTQMVGENARSSTESNHLPAINKNMCKPQNTGPQSTKVLKAMVQTAGVKHIEGECKHGTKDARTKVKANQSNASHLECRETNTVVPPEGDLFRHNNSVPINGESKISSSAEHDVQNEVNNSSGQHCVKDVQGDLIAARKRQRDAVNAILPLGALISCKRPKVSRTSSQLKLSSSANVLRNASEKLPMSREVCSVSMDKLSEKSMGQTLHECDSPRHQDVRAESSSHHNMSGRQDQLSEEWERFVKKLDESKTIKRSVRGSSTGPSKLPSS